MKIVSFIGSSDSGKTTVIERLVKELKRRGNRIGYIKHAGEFEIDRKGTDTDRAKNAGAAVVCVSMKGKWAAISDAKGDADPKALAAILMNDCDVIIFEGYKNLPYPKIEVFRSSQGRGLLSTANKGLVAVVSDVKIDAEVPIFRMKDAKKLADFIEKKFKNKR